MFPKDVFLHLGHRVARQFWHHDQPSGMLEPRERHLDRSHDLVQVELNAGFGHDYPNSGLTQVTVRHADDRAFQHTGLCIQHQFDFLGVDVVAAGNDQVLVAAKDVQITVFVDLP